MIIITNEILDNAFGDLRINNSGELYSWSVEELSKRDIYGKDVRYLIAYNECSDPQKYVDYWMKSGLADMEVAEYYNTINNMEDDNMNKYETLLKKYGALYKDFEDYKIVTEGLAEEGTYIKNEALAELLEIKDKFNSLYKEHTVYCSAAEDVTVKLIETEKKYDELKEVNDKLRNTIDSIYEGKRKLKEERDGLKIENDGLYKEFATVKSGRDELVKEIYHLHEVIRTRQEQVKEKMDKIKQRDKQITELNRKNNVLKEERDRLKMDLIKERDSLAKRLEHINAMSNLEWEFEVVEETETQDGNCIGFAETPPITSYYELMSPSRPATPYDELVDFCEKRTESCAGCPNGIACNGINMGLRPIKWNEDEKAEYNELMNIDIAEYCNKIKNIKEDK